MGNQGPGTYGPRFYAPGFGSLGIVDIRVVGKLSSLWEPRVSSREFSGSSATEGGHHLHDYWKSHKNGVLEGGRLRIVPTPSSPDSLSVLFCPQPEAAVRKFQSLEVFVTETPGSR